MYYEFGGPYFIGMAYKAEALAAAGAGAILLALLSDQMRTASIWGYLMNYMSSNANAGYRVVTPPDHISPFASTMRWQPDSIDYSQHPAYKDLIAKADGRTMLRALAVFSKSLALLLAKRLIQYEMIPLDVRSSNGVAGKLAFASAALKNMFRLKEKATDTAAGDFVHERLVRDGICVIEIPSARFFELEAQSDAWFKRLAEVRGESKGDRAFNESRSSVTRQSAPELFRVINDIFEESGVTPGASKFLGRQAKLVDVNPQINDNSDTFWKRIFGDLPVLAKPKLAYHHRDASGGDLKAIFYMNDVGPSTGPFTFAVGSHKMGLSRFDDWICEAQDQCFMAGTDLEARRHFASLPLKLRQKGAFGNDLMDGNPLGEAIDKAQWQITGQRGSIVLFDTKGVHRGGMVEEGDRRVITCVMG